MNRIHVLENPVKIKDLSLDDYLSEELGSKDWKSKSKKLQIRRWRMLKRSINGKLNTAR